MVEAAAARKDCRRPDIGRPIDPEIGIGQKRAAPCFIVS
jgi:hypothetical protein